MQCTKVFALDFTFLFVLGEKKIIMKASALQKQPEWGDNGFCRALLGDFWKISFERCSPMENAGFLSPHQHERLLDNSVGRSAQERGQWGICMIVYDAQSPGGGYGLFMASYEPHKWRPVTIARYPISLWLRKSLIIKPISFTLFFPTDHLVQKAHWESFTLEHICPGPSLETSALFFLRSCDYKTFIDNSDVDTCR